MSSEISETEALRRAIEIAGSQQALAKKISATGIKVTQQAVSIWVAEGKPSKLGAIGIEEALQGEINRSQLRPDIFSQNP